MHEISFKIYFIFHHGFNLYFNIWSQMKKLLIQFLRVLFVYVYKLIQIKFFLFFIKCSGFYYKALLIHFFSYNGICYKKRYETKEEQHKLSII